MLKNLLYSTFLNIGIIVLFYSAFIAYNKHQYGILVGAVLAACVLIFFKIKILKQVKKASKK